MTQTEALSMIRYTCLIAYKDYKRAVTHIKEMFNNVKVPSKESNKETQKDFEGEGW